MAGKAQSARQRSAAANLRAAGIPSDGRAPYTQWRALTASQRGQAIAARAQADQTYRAGGSMASVTAGRRSGPRRVVELPGRRIIQTGSARVVRGEVAAAARSGRDVVIRATFQDGSGQWRTRTIEGRSLYIGKALAGAGATTSGARPGRVDAWTPGTPTGRQLVEVQTVARGDGIDADELDDWLDDEAVWDAIEAMWEAEGIYGDGGSVAAPAAGTAS